MKLIIALASSLITATCCAQTLDPEIAKWEPEIAALEERDKAESDVRDAILFYGSSSIRLWKSIEEDMAPWTVLQRGYGGANLSDASHYAVRIVAPHVGIENPRRCRAVVIFVANDIRGSAEDVSPEMVMMRFRQLQQAIRFRDETVPIFWINVTPTQARWKAWQQANEANQRIEELLDRDPHSYVIHTAGAFIAADGKPNPALFAEDKLHLNETGYDIWAALIKSKLHAVLTE